VRSIRLYLALHAACLGVISLPGSVCAQDAQTLSGVSEIPLPGGIKAALAVINDPVPPDRGQFLVEVIRRTYATQLAVRSDPRDAPLRALLAHLERERHANAQSSSETVPLPLTPAIWIDVVFGGRATSDGLAGAILASRDASLFYYGLMSLDGATREWIASQRTLVSELATRHAAAFVVAAPGFRVADGRVRVPGGGRTESAWEALIGRRVTEPAEFLRTLLTADSGRTGYFLSAMSELSPVQFAFAVGADPANAASALRRLNAVFDRVTPGWRMDDRTLWRPRRDPALLLADLAVDDRGTPFIPGSRTFWAAVFSGNADGGTRSRGVELVGGPPDFSWLSEQVFSGTPAEERRRYEAVLFASRVVKDLTPATAADAVETVRSALTYPALAAVLERARVSRVATYAIASRRAARVSAITHDERGVRALSQFQGTTALLARMVSQGSITPEAFDAALTSLSQVEADRQGTYNGALVRWFAGWVGSAKPKMDLDEALLQLLSGPPPAVPRSVDWEGTRYTVDLTAAEGVRLARLLGEHPHPYLSAAAAMSGSAADEAWARGAVELAYAIALGQPEHAVVSVGDVARRHDFGVRPDPARTFGPWTIPVADVSFRGYRIGGALLGLESALAEFSITRVSAKAPPRKPSVSSEERAVFVATVPLVEPALLSDDDRDVIVHAIRAGRARVAAVRSSGDADALAQSIPLGPIRRTVFPWIVAHDSSRAASFFSPVELLWLGLGNTRSGESLHQWGVSAHARLGCLCLRIDRRSADLLTGRVNAGMLASGIPDLGLRLAELLADLHMPAALLGGVLASATFDFVNGASSRDENDRRGLVEFVLALRVDRVEEYLGMLTTGGPLVPPRTDSDRLSGVAPGGRRP
jgi:hypothetical protein